MTNTKDPWFVIERSRALASLLLTSRTDVRILNERERDDGTDFWVAIDAGEAPATRVFVVQVKGTTSSDPADWMQNVKQLFRAGSSFYLPACVLVANVRDNRAVYAWVAEPSVVPKGGNLRFHQEAAFQPLDTAAVDQMIERVKAYYDALPRHLQPA